MLTPGHSPDLYSMGNIREALRWMVRDDHQVEAELWRSNRAFVTDREKA